MTAAMLGFPGEDYTTPQTIKATGGFGNPADRAERLDRLAWAVERTVALGLDTSRSTPDSFPQSTTRGGLRCSTRSRRPDRSPPSAG